MKKNTRPILLLCTIAIVMVFTLQLYWIKTYYNVSVADFEKEANKAFEFSLKRDFKLRCDTMQHLIAQHLLDTSEFLITSQLDRNANRYIYTISNAHNKSDKYVSSSIVNSQSNSYLTLNTAQIRKIIAENFAKSLRTEDLENHIVYYRTQNLGNFETENLNRYAFDTTRFRHVFRSDLRRRNINLNFSLNIIDPDTVSNDANALTLTKNHPIVTKSFPIYNQKIKQEYVNASFISPSSYIISQMFWICISSFLLCAIVTISLTWLIRLLFKEKRLSVIKNDFISNITHELKTPIATATAALDALINFDILNDKQKARAYLAHSKTGLETLASLVDKILNISVYENQQFEIKKEPLDVEILINNIVGLYVENSEKATIVNYENDTNIQCLKADKVYFQHAVSNVIDNAIKYSGKTLNLDIRCKINGNFFIIEFTDDGIGVSKQNLPFVFEKFFRVVTHNQHKIKGHGLGLNYVRSILERHRGWCKMESNYGKGSTLSLGWPI